MIGTLAAALYVLYRTAYGTACQDSRATHTSPSNKKNLNMENNAGGADGVPDIADVDGFVESDAEEEEPDAHAQNAQPVEVDIPPTLQWGVVSAQLQAWEYKSANKTAEGTLAALRAVASPELGMYQCVQKSFMCASIVKGGKNSIANGLVAIVVEETDTVRTATYLRENGFVACNMEVTEETVGNGAVVDADINLGVRMIDLYRAAGGQDRGGYAPER